MAIKTKKNKAVFTTNSAFTGIVLGLATAGAIAAPANARSSTDAIFSSALPISVAMSEGARTMAPFGHIVLCMSTPSECQTRGVNMSYHGANAYLQRVSFSSSSWSVDPIRRMSFKTKPAYAPVTLTSNTWAQLTSVNNRVNAEIRPRADGSNASVDFWSTSGRYGDCEDYAIRKRQALIQLGWPSHSVLITLADHPRFGPHAVLIARTSNGDFVLDNLRNNVKAWSKVNYNWEKRQSLQDPKKWVSLNNRISQSTRIASFSPVKSLAPVKYSIPVPTSKPKLERFVGKMRIDKSLTTASVKSAPAISYTSSSKNNSYPSFKTVEFTGDWAFGTKSNKHEYRPVPNRFSLD